MSRIPTTIRKLFFGGSIAFAVMLVCFGVFCYHVVTKSFPITEGTISGVEVTAPVNIFRDSYGVPHVMASNESDLWFAMGYVHAQDRLFQMDLGRRTGEGRLSEIFGTRAIAADALFRTIGIRRTAIAILATLPAATRKALDDYARGVNAYIATRTNRMPVEFDVLNYKPDPWTPLHSIVLMRLVAWELNTGWTSDIAVHDIIARVGPKMGLDLCPPMPSDAQTILRDEHSAVRRDVPGGNLRDSMHAATSYDSAVADALRSFAAGEKSYHALLGQPMMQSGSNAWVVGPSRAAHGRPILCNDPHLILSTPSRWYQVHLNAGSLNVAGVTIPGIPFVVAGRNNAVAWGITSAMLDDCDFVIERLDSANPLKYLSHGMLREMRVRPDTMHVRDTEDVVLKLYDTEHGPVISAVHPYTTPARYFDVQFADKPHALLAGSAVSLRWMGSVVSDECTVLLKMNKARNSREFVDALSGTVVPAQNLAYADTLGNIGYAMAGAVPVRDVPYPGVSSPVSGAQDNMIWSSYLSWGQLPRLQNPRSGAIAMANNKPSADLSLYFSNMWEPPSRITRINELLESHTTMGVEDMKRMQIDVISPHALDATRYILAAFPDSATQQPLVKQALTYLSNWDGSMGKEEIAASVFNTWLSHMFEALWKDRLGSPAYEEYLGLQGLPYRAFTALLRSPQSDWFDNVRTPQREGRDEMIRHCMLDALQDLTARFNSTEIKRWQWGELHTFTFKHVLGRVKPLDKVLNIGPFPAAGSLTTINNAQFDFLHLFESSLGPSMRMICDLSTKHILCVLAGGVSGQPFSPHYSDQTPLWRNGGYLEMTIDPADIPQAGWTRVVLEK